MMFKVSVADLCLFGPSYQGVCQLSDTGRSTGTKNPSLGSALQALSISHCAYQLPEESEERHEMIRSLREMQSNNNISNSTYKNMIIGMNTSDESDAGKQCFRKLKTNIRHDADEHDANEDTHSHSPLSSNLPPLIVDPYRVLQVRRDATPQEIRHAYRRLSLWHHPGRSLSCQTIDQQERYRRVQVFEILAACYETLTDKESRRRCDGLLRDVEQQRAKGSPCTSVSNVNTTCTAITKVPVQSMHLSNTASTSMNLFQRIPILTPASSASSLEGEDLPDDVPNNNPAITLDVPRRNNNKNTKKPNQGKQAHPMQLLSCGIDSVDLSSERRLPSLIQNSTSTSTTDTANGVAAMHYSETETNRLFGGPLQLLYRSRRWKPFTDPFEVFSLVFGIVNGPLSRPPDKDWAEWKAAAAAAAAALPVVAKSTTTATTTTTTPAVTRCSAAWTGSSETLPDGTVVYTTRRTLNNRIMTRTETVRTDKKTGRKHSFVSVTSETVVVLLNDEDDEHELNAKRQASCHFGLDTSSCNVLEFCMLFYQSDDTVTAAAASTPPPLAIVETSSFASTNPLAANPLAIVDEIHGAETFGPEAGGGCHVFDACMVWNPAGIDDTGNNKVQQSEASKLETGGCHLLELLMCLHPESSGKGKGTNNDDSNDDAVDNDDKAVSSPKKVKVVSPGVLESLLDPRSWGLCGQWFPE